MGHRTKMRLEPSSLDIAEEMHSSLGTTYVSHAFKNVTESNLHVSAAAGTAAWPLFDFNRICR